MFWYAFVLGLAGSLHCAGMCGPLMLAIPLPLSARWQAAGHALTYQTGRILTYTLLGALFGLLGKGIAVAGFQQAVSVAAGLAMIAAALFTLKWEQAVLRLPGLQGLAQRVQITMGRLLRDHPGRSAFTLGLLNGLVPCGLVYAAVAGAISTFGGWEGALFMLLFGLGTLPLLFALMLSGSRLAPGIRRKFQMAQPLVLLVAGGLLLYRGLHLDLSLFLSAVPPAEMECH